MLSDKELILLFDRRDENAVRQLHEKYGRYCRSVATSVLKSEADAEECVNDAYLKVWNSIPPACPDKLPAYLAAIVRNTALDRLRSDNKKKSIPADRTVPIDELREIPAAHGDPANVDNTAVDAVAAFLRQTDVKKRRIFIARYLRGARIAEIAEDTGLPEGTVTSMLHRTRKELEKYLRKEGVEL